MSDSIFQRLVADETGANSIEYGLVAMLIAVALVGTMMALGNEVETSYETVGTEYGEAANGKQG